VVSEIPQVSVAGERSGVASTAHAEAEPLSTRPAVTAAGERPVAVALAAVSKRFLGSRGGEPVVAVDGVQLDIADGEFFSLLGPSGCGKTTTLRMIAGFEYPSAGSIRIFGQEVGLEPPNKRPVNTVFQSYALFPHMTVEENVAFGLQMQGVEGTERERRVRDVLGLVQLSGLDGRRPKQLSGGQQQRVALARALVNHPKVLLLDEPLGALDLKLRQAMQIELKQLQERVGITFVYVTHDQEEALTMSDRIAVMDRGRLLQVGTPADVYDRPRTRFVADFIGDSNLLDAEVLDDASMRLADGTVIRVVSDRRPGARVTVAIRPEKLALWPHDAVRDPALDAVHGVIRRVTFMGNATVYEVVAGEGDARIVVHVRQGNAPGVEHFGPGDRVRVRWAPVSAAVLED
jgi:spermidine/putrescine transport system ATP-binding protein